jgi:hypothetical protein
MDINCQFSDPRTFDNSTPQTKQDFWQYQNLTCSSTYPEFISKITSTSTPERSFYISNTIDLGQVLMLGFLILILVFSIMISIKHLIFKKF